MNEDNFHIFQQRLWPTIITTCQNPDHPAIKDDLISYFTDCYNSFEYDIESGVAVDFNIKVGKK